MNSQSARKTILIVDDDPTIRAMLATKLDESYDVLMASDGVDAAHVYERNLENIAAILTELHMPRLDGQSLAEWVHHISPHLPIIIMSGSTRREDMADFSRRPQTSFLGKPFESSQLKALLRDALQAGEEAI